MWKYTTWSIKSALCSLKYFPSLGSTLNNTFILFSTFMSYEVISHWHKYVSSSNSYHCENILKLLSSIEHMSNLTPKSDPTDFRQVSWASKIFTYWYHRVLERGGKTGSTPAPMEKSMVVVHLIPIYGFENIKHKQYMFGTAIISVSQRCLKTYLWVIILLLSEPLLPDITS